MPTVTTMAILQVRVSPAPVSATSRPSDALPVPMLLTICHCPARRKSPAVRHCRPRFSPPSCYRQATLLPDHSMPSSSHLGATSACHHPHTTGQVTDNHSPCSSRATLHRAASSLWPSPPFSVANPGCLPRSTLKLPKQLLFRFREDLCREMEFSGSNLNTDTEFE